MDNGRLFVIMMFAVPLTALMIPIAKIISDHRRFTAELRMRGRAQEKSDEVEALRREFAELKEMVHTQMLALDRYSKLSDAHPPDEAVRERVSGGVN